MTNADAESSNRPAATKTIAFIGAGNMARSLVGGLLRAGHRAEQLIAADPATEQLAGISALDDRVRTMADNDAAVAAADVVVLAVKPQIMQRVCEPLKASFHAASERGLLIISIAAGINLDALGAWCGRALPIVRCMPNTPALHGVGITAFHGNAHTTPADMAVTDDILAAAGRTRRVDDEALLDPVTGVSGSGPAYFFLFMEALCEAGIQQGLEPEVARELAVETAYGAAVMARSTNDPLSLLRERVTSPNGTTERALQSFAGDGLVEIVARAVAAATQRSRELAQEMAP